MPRLTHPQDSHSAQVPESPKIWSLAIRGLHWGLVLSIGGAFVTAWAMPPSALILHVWFGAAAGLIVVFRLCWGIWGTGAARFCAFPLSIPSLWMHGKAVFRALVVTGKVKAGKGVQWDGHPPLGAAMVVILLLVVLAQVVVGAVVFGGVEQGGPLAGWVRFSVAQPWKGVHSVLAFCLIAAVVAHILGVVVESWIMGCNLPRSMITGRRQYGAQGRTPGPDYSALDNAEMTEPAGSWHRPLIISLVCCVCVIAVAWTMSGKPLPEVQNPQAVEVYQRECGACHVAYPPSALPAKSWATLLEGLDDHFGEDATLDQDDLKVITHWVLRQSQRTKRDKLSAFAASVSKTNPLQVTQSAQWLAVHSDISSDRFSTAPVNSPANCQACHQDAKEGVVGRGFRRVNIHVPE